MLTPKFTITQDAEFVYVTIKVPYIRVSAAELITEDCTFTFYCKPYHLKLTFPYAFKEEDEECKATYDPFNDNGTLVAHLPKLEVGQHFPNLDLTSKLLFSSKSAKDASTSGVPSIEILGSEDYGDDSPMDEEDEELQYPQQIMNLGINEVKYGFNNLYSKIFIGMRDELLDMTEIKHPDQILAKYRAMLRISCENQLFDPARYLGDQMDGEIDPIFMEAMSFRSFYNAQWDAWKDRKPSSAEEERAAAGMLPTDPRDRAFEVAGGFTEAEKEALSSKLPRKEYLFSRDGKEQFGLLLGLADILFAHCYDHRLTLGDGNVESAHTIARLSCTFSWLEDFSLMCAEEDAAAPQAQQTGVAGSGTTNSDVNGDSISSVKGQPLNKAQEEAVSNVIKFNLRRCMIYPYLRVWKLARKVLADVARILFLGRRAILKCLLQLRSTFEHTDTHYLLNKIYVDDYCNWVQQDALSEEALQAFAKTYNAAKGAIERLPGTGKELMGFYLPEIEAWAAAQAEESGEDSASECDDDGGSESATEDSDSSSDDSESEGEDESGSDSSGSESDAGEDAESSSGIAHEQDAEPTPSSDIVSLSAEATPPLAVQSGKTQSSAVAEGEAEWTVPEEYTDYAALQRGNPLLRYLVSAAEDELSLLGGVAAMGGVSGEKALSEGDANKDSAINKLLLLPKRKAEAEAQLDDLIAGVGTGSLQHTRFAGAGAGAGGSSNKRVLIEELSGPDEPAPESDYEPVPDMSADVANKLSQLSVDGNKAAASV